MKDIQSELSETGRVSVRPSGTEPVIRVMVEDKDPDVVARVSDQLVSFIKSL